MTTDNYYMKQVLNLARATKGQALPNPAVAAIIVKDNQVIGTGIHLAPGLDHAEVIAINQAGARAEGATLYINLEPCSHYGRTPPCVNTVIAAKVKRVVVANIDSNPLVAGSGIAKLKDAGIEVAVGELEEECYELNKIFFHNIKFKQPFVTLKVGMSLDGKIATKNNLSKWITAADSRKDENYLRATHHAILVGVIADDPQLTPYLADEQDRPHINPIRIVLDHQLRTPINSKLVQDEHQTWIFTANADSANYTPYQNYGVKVIYLETLDINSVLDLLYEHGVCSLMVEGGEAIYASFIDVNKVNQLVCYISPQLIGSKNAKHLFAGHGFDDLTDNMKLTIREVKQLGQDIKIIADCKSLDFI